MQMDMDTMVLRMRKHDLFAQGLIYDNETQQLMHDVRVIIHNQTNSEYDTVITAGNGFYSFFLLPQRNYGIRAEKDHFLPVTIEINTLQIMKGTILNDFVLEEEYVDKEVISFDFDKFDLLPEDSPILNAVTEFLKKYRETTLVIGAHADARGTKEYNQELSDSRAKTVLQYFLSRGIEKNRIIARGFGEGLILNRCVDGINCHEEDHSKNRRAELKIEEELPEEEFE